MPGVRRPASGDIAGSPRGNRRQARRDAPSEGRFVVHW